MFYKKNMGSVERAARVLVGCATMLCGWVLFRGAPLTWVLAVSGVGTIATGLVGFCPACAAIGRRPVDEA